REAFTPAGLMADWDGRLQTQYAANAADARFQDILSANPGLTDAEVLAVGATIISQTGNPTLDLVETSLNPLDRLSFLGIGLCVLDTRSNRTDKLRSKLQASRIQRGHPRS